MKKTKIMANDKTKSRPKINVENCNFKKVTHFDYLGTNINNAGDCAVEIKRRTAMVLAKLKQLKKLWQGTNIRTKLCLLRICVFPVATWM